MTQEEFLTAVQQRTRLASHPAAERLTATVLETLAESLSGSEARDLASQLPGELEQYLTQGRLGESNAVSFSLDGFAMRVAEREDIDVSLAQDRAGAVMSVVQEAVSEGEIDHIRSQLGSEFDELLGKS